MRIIGITDKNCRAVDFQAYIQSTYKDNKNDISRLKKNLKRAIKEELTTRQKQLLIMYYYENKNMREIGDELGIDKSTVSRNLRRARGRLQKVLKYTL